MVTAPLQLIKHLKVAIFLFSIVISGPALYGASASYPETPPLAAAAAAMPYGERLACFNVMDQPPREGRPQYPGGHPVFLCDASDANVMKFALGHVSVVAQDDVLLGGLRGPGNGYTARALLNRPKTANPAPYGPAYAAVKAAFKTHYREGGPIGGGALIVRARVSEDESRYPHFRTLYCAASFAGSHLREISEGVCTLPVGMNIEIVWALLATLKTATTVIEREQKLMELYTNEIASGIGSAGVVRFFEAAAKNKQLFSIEFCHWAAYFAVLLHRGSSVDGLKRNFSWIYKNPEAVEWLGAAGALYNSEASRPPFEIGGLLSAAVATDLSESGSVADTMSVAGTVVTGGDGGGAVVEDVAPILPGRSLVTFYVHEVGAAGHPSGIAAFRFDAADAPVVYAALLDAGYTVQKHALHGFSSRYFDSGVEYDITRPRDISPAEEADAVILRLLGSAYGGAFFASSGHQHLGVSMSKYGKYFSLCDGNWKSAEWISLDVVWAVLQALECGPSVELREQKLRSLSRRLPRALTLMSVGKSLCALASQCDAVAEDVPLFMAYLSLLLTEKMAPGEGREALAWVFGNMVVHNWLKKALVLYKNVGKRLSFDAFDYLESVLATQRVGEVLPEESCDTSLPIGFEGGHRTFVTEIVRETARGARRTQLLKILYMEGCSTEYITRILLSGEEAFSQLADVRVIIARDCNFNDGAGLRAFISNFPQLRRLYVNGSHISSVPADLLHAAPLLELLDLSANGIKAIPAHFFTHTPHLRHINLSSNRLTAIFDPMSDLSELGYFACADNPSLKRLPEGLLNAAKGLQVFNVARCCSLAELPDSFMSAEHPELSYFVASDTGLSWLGLQIMLGRCPVLKRAVVPEMPESSLVLAKDAHLIEAFEQLVEERTLEIGRRYPELFEAVPVEAVFVAPATRSLEEVLASDASGSELQMQRKIEEILGYLHVAFSLNGGLSLYNRPSGEAVLFAAQTEAEKFYREEQGRRCEAAEAALAREAADAVRLASESLARRKSAEAKNKLVEEALTHSGASARMVIGVLQALEPALAALHRFCLGVGLMHGGLTAEEYKYALGSFVSSDVGTPYVHYDPHMIFDALWRAKTSLLSLENQREIEEQLASTFSSERQAQLALMSSSCHEAMRGVMRGYVRIKNFVEAIDKRLYLKDSMYFTEKAFLSAEERMACQCGSKADGFFGAILEALLGLQAPLRALREEKAFDEDRTPQAYALFMSAYAEFDRCVTLATRVAVS